MEKADRWLIKNGIIYDGTGGKPYHADLVIEEDRITGIGKWDDIEGANVVYADNRVVCPGFIDIHRHADLLPFSGRGYEAELCQGITTIISGNCGFSPFPFKEQNKDGVLAYIEPLLGTVPASALWQDLAAYFRSLREKDAAVNMGMLAGSGTLRVAYNGNGSGRVSGDTMHRILENLDELQEQGAFGLSMGLMYAPECFYMQDELKALCSQVKQYENVVTVHLRGEGRQALPSIRELLEIAGETGVHIHISHLKSAGRTNWGQGMDDILSCLHDAVAKGLTVTWDAYPYDAGSTTLSTLLPPWVLDGGEEMALARLGNKEEKERIKRELRETNDQWDNLVAGTGWERVKLLMSRGGSYNEISIKDLADERDVSGEEMFCRLCLEEMGRNIVFYHMSPVDVEKVVLDKNTIIISDALYSGQGFTHPRATGSFPRFLRKYAIESKKISLEETIRKCTSAPAQCLKIAGRGTIKEGYYADVIMFDPENLKDFSTYEYPDRKSQGIDYIWINGRLAFKAGTITDNKAGRFLRKERRGK